MHAREAQATTASVQANHHSYQGELDVWNFGLELPDSAVGRLQTMSVDKDDVLALLETHRACFRQDPVILRQE